MYNTGGSLSIIFILFFIRYTVYYAMYIYIYIYYRPHLFGYRNDAEKNDNGKNMSTKVFSTIVLTTGEPLYSPKEAKPKCPRQRSIGPLYEF